jgi:hypothetical protein
LRIIPAGAVNVRADDAAAGAVVVGVVGAAGD